MVVFSADVRTSYPRGLPANTRVLRRSSLKPVLRTHVGNRWRTWSRSSRTYVVPTWVATERACAPRTFVPRPSYPRGLPVQNMVVFSADVRLRPLCLGPCRGGALSPVARRARRRHDERPRLDAFA